MVKTPVPSFSCATLSNLSIIFLHAISVALPLRSAPVLAEVGEVLITRVVFVLSIRIRSGFIDRVLAAIVLILVLTPCPISIAPVVMPTLPSQ